MNKMYEYLEEHAYISKNKKSNYQFELSKARAECIANKYNSLCEEKGKEIERLNNIINNDDVYGYIKYLEDLTTKKDTIINEFEEELKWQRKVSLSLNEAFAVSRIDVLINCLQELKGDGSNE